MRKLVFGVLTLLGFALAQDVGELGLKIQSAKFQDVSDRKAYASLFAYVRTSPVSKVGLEIGNANMESEIFVCGFSFCNLDIDYTPIEINFKLDARGRGYENFAVGLGAGISFNILQYEVYRNGVRVAEKNKNLIGWQIFGNGRYFFTPARSNFNAFMGVELKYQWVDSFTESGGKVELSNTRIGLELGVLF